MDPPTRECPLPAVYSVPSRRRGGTSRRGVRLMRARHSAADSVVLRVRSRLALRFIVEQLNVSIEKGAWRMWNPYMRSPTSSTSRVQLHRGPCSVRVVPSCQYVVNRPQSPA